MKFEISIKEMLLEGLKNIVIISGSVALAAYVLVNVHVEILAFLLAMLIIGAAIFYTKSSFYKKVTKKIKPE